MSEITPHNYTYAERAIVRDLTALWDRVGDELGIFLKPVMYKVSLNDQEIERDFIEHDNLDTYRFYFSEGIPVDNSKNGDFGTAFDRTRFTFLHQLEEVAKEHNLDLVFPEDVIGVWCNDLKPLRTAIDILKKRNRVVASEPPEPSFDEEKFAEIAAALSDANRRAR